MSTIAPQRGFVTVGVDTHSEVHVVAVVTDLGRMLGSAAFPTTPAGTADLLRWAAGHGTISGVGTDTAGALLVALGDNPDRLRNESSFAHLRGVAPLPASSGKTTGRYRLNRGGNRSANNALWHIVLVRIGTDARTKDYVARRTTEGRSKPEIMRYLKRYVAREVYTALHPTHPQPALDDQ